MTLEHLKAFLQRCVRAQEAIDDALSTEQQFKELMPDDTYRVRCFSCGKSVSNPLPVPVILRAFAECPECMERGQSDRSIRVQAATSEK